MGLLVGDRRAEVERVMTCLTITPASVAEAARERAQLIVAHHPLPFKPLQKLTTDTTAGRMLLELCAARIAVYSPHTAFDSALHGINRQWAAGLELEDVQPLVPKEERAAEANADEDLSGASPPASVERIGAGRCGRLASPATLADFAQRVKAFLGLNEVRGVGQPERRVSRVGIACGSGGDFLAAARRRGCDCLVTGEANFHICLEAEATGVGLILTGHFASERFAVERLAEHLAKAFPTLQVWASRDEREPISRW